MDDVVALASQLEDASRLIASAWVDAPGKNAAQTSWIGLSPYEFGWGRLGGKDKDDEAHIEAVRTLDVGVINGGQVVLPRLPDGGVEFIVGVEEACLPRLLADPWLAKYAQLR